MAGGASHEGKAREGDDAVHKRAARAQRVVEELAHGEREIQATSKDRDDLHDKHEKVELVGGCRRVQTSTLRIMPDLQLCSGFNKREDLCLGHAQNS